MAVDFNKKTDSLILLRIRDGGYLVRTYVEFNSGNYSEMLFACTTMNEALKYIRDKIGAR